MSTDRCHVNDIFGGGVFVCRRQLAPGGNGYCEYHGRQNAITLKLELTWRAWFRVQFVRRPLNLWRWIRECPRKIQFWWSTRNNPPCAFCQNKSMVTEHGKRVCFDHYGP